MNNLNIYERALTIGNYIVETNSTVRKAAIEFGVSKSTVYVDITRRLKIESPILHKEVAKVLTKNKNERYYRGGNATRQKYLNMKR